METKKILWNTKQKQTYTNIQVTKQLSAKETITREFGNLEKIKDNYPKYVISLDKHASSQNGIKHLYLKDFLKGNFN